MGTTDENFSSEMMPSDYVPNMQSEYLPPKDSSVGFDQPETLPVQNSFNFEAEPKPEAAFAFQVTQQPEHAEVNNKQPEFFSFDQPQASFEFGEQKADSAPAFDFNFQ